jgi:hypothetical protein
VLFEQVDFAAARAPLAERKRKADEHGKPGATKQQRSEPSNAAAPDTQPPPRTQNATKKPAARRVAGLQPAPRASAAATAKQRMVLTVAIGGVPSDRRDVIAQLAAAAGKVGNCPQYPAQTSGRAML